MAAVSGFFQMSVQQQSIESVWYEILVNLAGATGKTTEIVLSPEHKKKLGSDGITAIAQRCRFVPICHSFDALLTVLKLLQQRSSRAQRRRHD